MYSVFKVYLTLSYLAERGNAGRCMCTFLGASDEQATVALPAAADITADEARAVVLATVEERVAAAVQERVAMADPRPLERHA